jgi:hypothetical protein
MHTRLNVKKKKELAKAKDGEASGDNLCSDDAGLWRLSIGREN